MLTTALLRLAMRPKLHGLALAAPLNRTTHRMKSESSYLNVQADADKTGKYKTIDDLPGPSFASTVYWLFVKGYADKGHAMQCGVNAVQSCEKGTRDLECMFLSNRRHLRTVEDIKLRNLYGPIWRSRFGPFDMVNIASPELIAQLIRQEGQYPVRCELPHWKEYMDLRGEAYGLHVHEASGWHRIRSVLNPKMLKMKEQSAYAPVIHQVVDDLLQRLESLRLHSPDQASISNIAGELYKFGFEGIASILFETRLGCLQEEIPKDTLRFIAAVDNMLRLSETILFLPRWTRKIFPFWARFSQAWDDLYDIARNLIDRRAQEISDKVKRGEEVEGMYLTYLLSSDRISLGEVYTTITELMLGGVDTTSNTLSWTLYHLARDRSAQDRLYQEVSSVCPDMQLPSREDLTRMPYLKAVIKEILRLYPVVPGNARQTVHNEVVIDNYKFPKMTQFQLCHYATSHDETEFPDAKRFIPERWLRGHLAQSHHHPYSSIPFGVGVRACVGKRIAELEMYFALSRLIQRYEIRPKNTAQALEPKTRTLMIPAAPINLCFFPRV